MRTEKEALASIFRRWNAFFSVCHVHESSGSSFPETLLSMLPRRPKPSAAGRTGLLVLIPAVWLLKGLKR